MPLPWAKSNRSQASVGSSPDHSSISTAGALNQDPAAQRYADQKDQQTRPYGPGRSPSQRHSSTLSLERPVLIGETSTPLDRTGEQPYGYKHQASDSTHHSKKTSLRSKLGFGPSSRDSVDNTRGIGRRTSVRRSDNGDRYLNPGDDSQRLQAQQPWSQRQGSNTNLAPSREEDESDLDPFLQQHEDQPSPQAPPKDPQYIQQYQQYHEQYQRPTLARVNTDHSYPSQPGLEHYSPDQHGGISQQPQQQSQQQPQPQPLSSQQQQQQYISYSQTELHPNLHQQYQAFHPPTASSPHPLGPPPNYKQAGDHQQSAPVYTQHSQHQDNQQIQPSQQGHQPEFQHHQRPPSQQQQQQQHPLPPELHHPQPSHAVQQLQQQPLLQQGQDTQALRPPSSQQLAPPSPSAQYQTYDSQPPGYASPSNQQQQVSGVGAMPQGSQHRSGLRSSDIKGGQSTSLTRENSMAQSQQGQNIQPSTPGMATFASNVVPQQSQGQPYRGKQGQLQEGEAGRATPPPNRAINEMTEEDVHNLLKEHEILREKYQKVKRYFFDQQSQVHQLQNTLANQRLSLSRTSLDDSEYTARFKRLDGLISDLALSIRKNWKSIPPWLHPGVNKEAITTGGKEMIVVGRAFISYWLVEEVFDKYFHPDLEAGLSTQLRVVQHNIRRFAPLANNTEEEEALMSKIINWRLATLEGLAEQLRSTQSQTNRQRLVEQLNDKLIAAMENHLQEPSPPELAGGVHMIIELAVGIAIHLPLESRDVLIEYYLPGYGIMPDFMSIESGITSLTNPLSDSSVGSQSDAADKASVMSTDSKDDLDSSQSGSKQDQEKRSTRGMFGGLVGNKKLPAGKVSSGSGGGSQTSLPQQPATGSANGPKDDIQRVRMAAGVSVRIRHRSVLVKAPVYPTA